MPNPDRYGSDYDQDPQAATPLSRREDKKQNGPTNNPDPIDNPTQRQSLSSNEAEGNTAKEQEQKTLQGAITSLIKEYHIKNKYGDDAVYSDIRDKWLLEYLDIDYDAYVNDPNAPDEKEKRSGEVKSKLYYAITDGTILDEIATEYTLSADKLSDLESILTPDQYTLLVNSGMTNTEMTKLLQYTKDLDLTGVSPQGLLILMKDLNENVIEIANSNANSDIDGFAMTQQVHNMETIYNSFTVLIENSQSAKTISKNRGDNLARKIDGLSGNVDFSNDANIIKLDDIITNNADLDPQLARFVDFLQVNGISELTVAEFKQQQEFFVMQETIVIVKSGANRSALDLLNIDLTDEEKNLAVQAYEDLKDEPAFQEVWNDMMNYYDSLGIDLGRVFNFDFSGWKNLLKGAVSFDLNGSKNSLASLNIEDLRDDNDFPNFMNEQQNVVESTDFNLTNSDREKYTNLNLDLLFQDLGLEDAEITQISSLFRNPDYDRVKQDNSIYNDLTNANKSKVDAIHQTYQSQIDQSKSEVLDTTNTVIKEEGLDYCLSFLKEQLNINAQDASGNNENFVTELEIAGNPDLAKTDGNWTVNLDATVDGNMVRMQYNLDTGKLYMPQSIYKSSDKTIHLNNMTDFVEVPLVQGPTISSFNDQIANLDYSDTVKTSDGIENYQENLRFQIKQSVDPVDNNFAVKSIVKLQLQRNSLAQEFTDMIGLRGKMEIGKNTANNDLYFSLFNPFFNTINMASSNDLIKYRQTFKTLNDKLPSFNTTEPIYDLDASGQIAATPSNLMRSLFSSQANYRMDLDHQSNGLQTHNSFAALLGIFSRNRGQDNDPDNSLVFDLDRFSDFVDILGTGDHSISTQMAGVQRVFADGMHIDTMKSRYTNIFQQVRQHEEFVANQRDIMDLEGQFDAARPPSSQSDDHFIA